MGNKKWKQRSFFDEEPGSLKDIQEKLQSLPSSKLRKEVLPDLVKYGFYPSLQYARQRWQSMQFPGYPRKPFKEYLDSNRDYYLDIIDKVLNGEAKDVPNAIKMQAEEIRQNVRKMKELLSSD